MTEHTKTPYGLWSDASAHVAAFLGNVQGGAPISGEKLERLIALTSACCLLWEIMVGSGAKRLEPIKEAAQALRLAAMAEPLP